MALLVVISIGSISSLWLVDRSSSLNPYDAIRLEDGKSYISSYFIGRSSFYSQKKRRFPSFEVREDISKTSALLKSSKLSDAPGGFAPAAVASPVGMIRIT